MLIAKWLDSRGEERGRVTGRDSDDISRLIVSSLCHGEEWESFGQAGDKIAVEADSLTKPSIAIASVYRTESILLLCDNMQLEIAQKLAEAGLDSDAIEEELEGHLPDLEDIEK